MLFDDLTCSELEFQRKGTATEKARVITSENQTKRILWVLGSKENMENRYEGYPEERVR